MMFAAEENAELQPYGITEQEIPSLRKFKSCARPVVPIRERIATICSIAMATGFIWFLGNQSAHIDQMNYQVDQLQQSVQNMDSSNAWLAARVDMMEQPSYILQIAEGRLHMHFGAPVEISSGARSSGHSK